MVIMTGRMNYGIPNRLHSIFWDEEPLLPFLDISHIQVPRVEKCSEDQLECNWGSSKLDSITVDDSSNDSVVFLGSISNETRTSELSQENIETCAPELSHEHNKKTREKVKSVLCTGKMKKNASKTKNEKTISEQSCAKACNNTFSSKLLQCTSAQFKLRTPKRSTNRTTLDYSASFANELSQENNETRAPELSPEHNKKKRKKVKSVLCTGKMKKNASKTKNEKTISEQSCAKACNNNFSNNSLQCTSAQFKLRTRKLSTSRTTLNYSASLANDPDFKIIDANGQCHSAKHFTSGKLSPYIKLFDIKKMKTSDLAESTESPFTIFLPAHNTNFMELNQASELSVLPVTQNNSNLKVQTCLEPDEVDPFIEVEDQPSLLPDESRSTSQKNLKSNNFKIITQHFACREKVDLNSQLYEEDFNNTEMQTHLKSDEKDPFFEVENKVAHVLDINKCSKVNVCKNREINEQCHIFSENNSNCLSGEEHASNLRVQTCLQSNKETPFVEVQSKVSHISDKNRSTRTYRQKDWKCNNIEKRNVSNQYPLVIPFNEDNDSNLLSEQENINNKMRTHFQSIEEDPLLGIQDKGSLISDECKFTSQNSLRPTSRKLRKRSFLNSCNDSNSDNDTTKYPKLTNLCDTYNSDSCIDNDILRLNQLHMMNCQKLEPSNSSTDFVINLDNLIGGNNDSNNENNNSTNVNSTNSGVTLNFEADDILAIAWKIQIDKRQHTKNDKRKNCDCESAYRSLVEKGVLDKTIRIDYITRKTCCHLRKVVLSMKYGVSVMEIEQFIKDERNRIKKLRFQ